METELKEQLTNSKAPQLLPYQFKKGQSGNPMGRPPGRSLKDRAKAYLSGLTDEEAIDFFEGMDKKVVWEMAEGKAEAKDTMTVITPNINIAEDIANKYAITPSPKTDSKE